MRGIAPHPACRCHAAVRRHGGALPLPAVAAVIRDRSGSPRRFFFLFFYVWMRATLPRFRYDQLMSFGWKLLLPVSLVNLVVTAFVIVCLLVGHR